MFGIWKLEAGNRNWFVGILEPLCYNIIPAEAVVSD
jgi:hypothetical protein